MNIDNDDKLIFVGGVPRSGTTLLQIMLDSHPDIYGGPEFDWLPTIVELRRLMQESVESGRINTFCSKETINKEIANFVVSLIMPVAERNGCTYISEKTPWNVLVFNELMDIFPKAHFINVVRDPRAVIASMLEVGKRGKLSGKKTPSYTRRIAAAVKIVEACQKSAKNAISKNPRRVLTIKYENIVTNPITETKKICDFLGIEWFAKMAIPSEVKHQTYAAINPIDPSPFLTKETYMQPPDSSRIERWKQTLNPLQQAYISRALGNKQEINQYGYTLKLDKEPIILKIIASWHYKAVLLLDNFLDILQKVEKRIRNRLYLKKTVIKRPIIGGHEKRL